MIHRSNLECDIQDRCNLSCKSCGHAAPFYKKNFYTFDGFQRDIEVLSKVFHCDVFSLIGGEPMLVGNKFPDYVRTVRESGICKRIKVNTNGTLLEQFGHHLKLVDWVHISWYQTKFRDKISDWFHANKQWFEDNGKEIYLHDTTHFSESFTQERLTDERAEESWIKCGARKTCNQLYNGKYFLCGPAAKFSRVLEERGIKIDERGCDLHAADLEVRLKEYLATKEKLRTCFHCRGHLEREKFLWREE